MPYIEDSHRITITTGLDLANTNICTAGDLTYAITYLMHTRVKRLGKSYANLSQIRACAQDAADEFYRVVMSPYEDNKRKENGPVSELDREI